MSVFIVLSKSNNDKIDQKCNKYIHDCVNFRNNYFYINNNSKFNKDNFIYEDENFIILLQGVILNDVEIIESNNCTNLIDCLKLRLELDTMDEFINDLRGNFVVIIFNKINETLEAFNDHWSNIPLFYMNLEDSLLISTEVFSIVEYLKINDINYKLDINGAYSLISYAYMIDNITLIDGVNKLDSGSKLIYFKKSINIKSYHNWNFNEEEIDFDEAIEKMDNLFLRAVKLQVRKNAQYNYKNVVPLSSGLDCRIVAYTLKRLGINNVLSYTYSESNSLDYKYCAKMAHDLKYEWLFKNLDNGLDLFNLEESIEVTDGLIYYPWASQFTTFLNLLNTENLGIIHTGVIGDVIPGSFNEKISDKNKLYNLGDGAYSKKLIGRLELNLPDMSFEEGMFKNRAINGACLGYSTSIKKFGFGMSPFMDVDFAEFCFSLPLEYRIRHKIYYSWVLKKFPDAARYPHNGIKISSGSIGINYKGKTYQINRLKDLLFSKIKSKITKRNNMNPFEYWYYNNDDLKKFMDDYFKGNKELLYSYSILYNDVVNLYDYGNVIEKTLVLSLLSYYKYLFT